MLPKPPLVIVVALQLQLALFSGGAAALGLGGMRTQSALNQPFYAEIELNGVRSDEIDAVKARLASREEFAKAGAERPHFLTRLQFASAIGTDGRPYIQVSSREPIREPYIDFLVEVLWPQGRLVKEFTVLLDPPARGGAAPPRLVPPSTSMARRQPPPEQAPPPPPLRRSAPPPQAATPPAPPTPSPRPVSATVPPAARDTRFPLYYGPVPRGATLSGIARELTPPGATVEQTAMALFRNNQDAFARGNINRLQVGKNLVVPTAEELFALDADQARRQFEDALAGRSVDTTPITDIPSDVRLRIAGRGETPLDASAAAPPGASAGLADVGPSLRDDLLMVQETTESTRQETSELRNRISELEAQLSDIQRLLQLRNEQLAQLQQQRPAGVDRGALPVPLPPALPPAGAVAGALAGAPDLAPAQPVVEPGIGMVAADGMVEPLLPPPSPIATAQPEPDGAAAGPAPELPVADGDMGLDPLVPDVADLGVAEDRPFWAGAMDTMSGMARAMPPWGRLAAAAGVLVLGGLGLIAYRRRREAELESALEEMDDMALAVPSDTLPGAGPGQGFAVGAATAGELDLDRLADLDSEPPLHSLHAPSPNAGPAIDVRTGLPITVVSNLPTGQQETQEADVIAEADIYILYGRYREAEALLREELERAPDRRDIKYKLGEALLGAGARTALADLLAEMRAAGDEQADPAKWARLEAGLAGLGGDDELAEPPPPPPRIKPLGDTPSWVGADELPTADAAQGRTALGEIEDAGLGLSVREVSPSGGDGLGEQSADLELDLQDMGDLGAELDLTRVAERATPPRRGGEVLSPSAAPGDDGPLALMTPSAAPEGEGLDLDLDDLEQLTAVPADSEPIGLTLALPEAFPDLDAMPEQAEDDGEQGPAARISLPDPMRTTATATAAPTERDDESADGGPLEESISADVLSSQWQMETGLWNEADTKLDLARAYIEMDDPDAARAILEEVLQDGSEGQRADASALLAQLG